MKLKYYLRGLGIGIVVVVLILSIVGGEKEVLSDAEIRERAFRLGMVDGSSVTLGELQNESAESTMESSGAIVEAEELLPDSGQPEENVAATQESEAVQQPEASGESQDGAASPSVAPAPIEEVETSTAPTQSAEAVTIIISSGQSSYTVSKNLAEAGLIEDAGTFDTYLCDNGYSRRISTGTYEILLGTSEDEIAKIITGKR